jgi:hypothetical protein
MYVVTATSGELRNRICYRAAYEVSTTIMLSLTYIFSKHGCVLKLLTSENCSVLINLTFIEDKTYLVAYIDFCWLVF